MSFRESPLPLPYPLALSLALVSLRLSAIYASSAVLKSECLCEYGYVATKSTNEERLHLDTTPSTAVLNFGRVSVSACGN